MGSSSVGIKRHAGSQDKLDPGSVGYIWYYIGVCYVYGLGCVGSGDNVGVFGVWMLIGSQGCGVCEVLGGTWGLMDT